MSSRMAIYEMRWYIVIPIVLGSMGQWAVLLQGQLDSFFGPSEALKGFPRRRNLYGTLGAWDRLCLCTCSSSSPTLYLYLLISIRLFNNRFGYLQAHQRAGTGIKGSQSIVQGWFDLLYLCVSFLHFLQLGLWRLNSTAQICCQYSCHCYDGPRSQSCSERDSESACIGGIRGEILSSS